MTRARCFGLVALAGLLGLAAGPATAQTANMTFFVTSVGSGRGADLGGLAIAYDAYHLAEAKDEGGKAPVIDGFTGDQRFFLSWAQVWRELATPDILRQRVLSDPHSPTEFRVNGAIRNLDGWYDAFGVKEGDALYLPPEKRARIW